MHPGFSDKLNSESQVFGAVGAIIELDGRFLLVQEGRQKADCGKWNQPAGRITPGEDTIEAIIREVKEETGLVFRPTGLIGVYSLYRHYLHGSNTSPHVLKLIFKGEITGGELIPLTDEISAVRWFTLEEIERMNEAKLRDPDIKQEIRDYLSGQYLSLDSIRHTRVQK